ncbi:hypothetical protein SAMN03159298_04869 [Pseudomonas sp. NFACC07-1]|nr:hypothetical protein SAMN03159298_04869 [Pseudomonas sp. NFACC07-1]
MAECQSASMFLIHRYREQARSHIRGSTTGDLWWVQTTCFCGSEMELAPSTAGNNPERKSVPLGC